MKRKRIERCANPPGGAVRFVGAESQLEIHRASLQYPAPKTMIRFACCALLILLAGRSAFAAATDDVYLLGPDSQSREGVPRGNVIGPLTLPSRVFPNTTRHYWIYVPAQYDPKEPAALMIFQDGHAFVSLTGDYRIPNVFDNLIYRREMPVTIGVFINPGRTPDQTESSASNWGDSINNRRVEYNELNDDYSRLIVDELLPRLKQDYNLSDNPEDRAIAGASSGAICAFTVAWHRPDQFRKVISTIGSFTNIRGGHVYPDLVRQTERKPIRIFLQDGLNDLRGGGAVALTIRNGTGTRKTERWSRPLTERGYDVNYCWGIGTHSNKQGGAIMPEMLRWLWRDYPRPDDPMDESNRTLLVPSVSAAADAGPDAAALLQLAVSAGQGSGRCSSAANTGAILPNDSTGMPSACLSRRSRRKRLRSVINRTVVNGCSRCQKTNALAGNGQSLA